MTEIENQRQTNSEANRRSSLRILSLPYLIPMLAMILIIAILVYHLELSQLFANPLVVVAGGVGIIISIHIFGVAVIASIARRKQLKRQKYSQDTDSKAFETEGRTIPWASFYDTLVWLVTLGRISAIRKNILQHSRIKAGDKVLDVGCGTGDLALAAAEITGHDGEISGTDASVKMIATAKRKAIKSGIDINFQVDLIESISFPDNYFDVVMNSLVMHHLPDDLKIKGFSEIYRVLKPGGHVLIVDIEGSSGISVFKRIFDLIINLHGGHKAMKENVSKLSPMAEASGFNDVQVGRLNRQLAFISAKKGSV